MECPVGRCWCLRVLHMASQHFDRFRRIQQLGSAPRGDRRTMFVQDAITKAIDLIDCVLPAPAPERDLTVEQQGQCDKSDDDPGDYCDRLDMTSASNVQE